MLPSALLALFISSKYPLLAKPVCAGLLFRLSLIFIHNYLMPLPGGLFDAMAFEERGWFWAQAGLQEIYNQVLAGPRSHFYSTHVAVVYYFFGRMPILLNMVSLFFSLGLISLVFLIARNIWGCKKAALKSAWVAALFPWFVLYSIHARREVFIFFFVAAGIYMLLKWRERNQYSSLVLCVFLFGCGVFYNTAVVFAIIGVGLLVVIDNISILVKKRKIKVFMVAAIVPAMAVVIYWLANADLANIGSSDEWLDVETTLDRISGRAHGGAAYPSFAIASSPFEVLLKAPISFLYFFGAPFPWDIRSPYHLVAFLDGVAYLIILYMLWKNFSAIWGNPKARAVMIVLAPFLLSFVFTVGNFGNGMRHRQKFLVAVVVLIAPFIKKIRFRK